MRFGIVCLGLCLTIFHVTAQIGLPKFKRLTTGDGLSQSSVLDIEQDQDGNMWFGTRDGLNKYDGNRFTVFRNDPEDPTTIINNDVWDLLSDRDGDLWVATRLGLALYDSKQGRFKRFSNYGEDVSNAVRSVIQLQDGTILAGTENGLEQVNKNTGEIFRRFQESSNNQILSSDIYKLYQDSQGMVWVGTLRGVVRLVTLDLDVKPVSYVLEKRVQTIVEDRQNRIWIGTNDGLFIIDTNGEIFPYNEVVSFDQIIDSDVRALEFDNMGNIWVGTYQGVTRFDTYGRALFIQNDPTDSESLSKNTVKTIFEDQEGSIWIGSYYGGINFWNEAHSNFQRVVVKESGLSYNVVSSIVEGENEIYLATEGGGVSVMNVTTGKFHYLPNDQSSNIKSLYLDASRRELWTGTFDAGIFIWDVDRRTIKKVINGEVGLTARGVYDIRPYGEDKMLLATFGGGLNIYDIASGHIHALKHNSFDHNTICEDFIRSTLVDSDSNLWIGTQAGLSVLKYSDMIRGDSSVVNYFYDADKDSGNDVLVIFEDSKGTIWVGTQETGLHRLDQGQFQKVDLLGQDKTSSKTVQAILEDDNGLFWISSNNGIIRYNPINGESRLFKESDGLVSNEYNINAALKSSDGIFYFGGPDGVSYFDPSGFKESSYTPNVVLTELEVRNQIVYPSDSTGILNSHISKVTELELDYDQAFFTIHFALPSFINPEKNSYAYRMIGLDENWKYTDVNQASFTIQEPGDYLFEVQGGNADQVWTDTSTILSVHVNPAPWRTWWAYLIYASCIGIALYFLLNIIRSRSELRANLEMEHRDNEQQKLLNQMKLQFFTNISHEFRTPLTLIVGPLQQIIQEYRGSSRLFKQLMSIEQNANQLLKLINQLMEFRKLENNQAQLRAAEGNLVNFVKEIFLSFRPYAKTAGYEYKFVSDREEILAYYDRDKMERVLYNLISNAFKYSTKEKKISVEIVGDNLQAKISIKDSGIGIEPESIPYIFDRFYQTGTLEQSKKEIARGTGIGLALVKGIVDLHQGEVKVDSALGQGSSFVVSLPLGRSHLDNDQIIEDFKSSESVEVYEEELKIQDSEAFDFGDINSDDNLKEKKVLVVEDNQEVRKFIVGLLEHSYEIHQVSNGKEGVQAARSISPDLIISDVMMPEMDGIELCTAIKSDINTSHIPVILLTARTSLIFKYEGLDSGADDYINKPFNIREFQLKVRNTLRMMDHMKQKFESKDVLSLSKVTLTSLDEDLFKKAIEIVDENISNEFFDVPLFCSELGLSRTMLFTKIKAWTSLTPNDFIQSMRMKRAAQFLEQGKVNVSQISYKVGYKNPKYFSKTFQKHYSMTPTEYSKRFVDTQS